MTRGGLGERIAARPWRAVWLGLGLAAVLAPFALRLRPSVDLVELLPEGSPAAASYRLWLERFGGLEQVFVLLELPAAERDAGVLFDAIDSIEADLRSSELVAAVRAGVEPEDEEFFLGAVLPNALLLRAPEERLAAARAGLAPAALRLRAETLARALRRPGGELARELALADPFGWSEGLVLRGGAGGAGIPVDGLSGRFVTADGRSALVLVWPAAAELDPGAGRRLESLLAAACERARAHAPELRCQALGGPLYAAQDEAATRRDLRATIASSALACTAILVAGFGGFLLPAIGGAAVAAALVAIAGAAGVLVPEVSALALAFAAVLIGLGIDTVIHLVAAFRSARGRGEPPGGAFRTGYDAVRGGIFGSTATTVLAFATLGWAHLRPLREVGLLVALGMVLMLLQSLLVGGGALVLAGSRVRAAPHRLWRCGERAIAAMVAASARRSGVVLGLVALLALGAAAGLPRLRLSVDPRALRSADHPAQRAELRLAEVAGLGADTATVIVLERDRARAIAAGRTLTAALRAALPSGEVTAASDWLAAPSAEELHELSNLPWRVAVAQLRRELRARGLDPRAFEPGLRAAERLAAGEPPAAAPAALPRWLEPLLDERQGDTALALQLRLPTGSLSGNLAAIERTLEENAPAARLASAALVGRELQALLRRDARLLLLLASLAIVVVVVVGFGGRPVPSALALVPVALGSLLALGTFGWLSGEIDLVGIIVLPVRVGIGVDYGLHALHGERVWGDLAASLRHGGMAMTLTAATTVAGFGSLAWSSVPSLRRGGVLIAAGVLLCLLSTLLALPALARVTGSGGR